MSAAGKTCCICGEYAGRFEQHWNRDEGYGICPSCIAQQAATTSPEEMTELYGTPGVHRDVPMVKYGGRRYRVLAFTYSEPEANAFMERTPGAAVLFVAKDGGIFIADSSDLGERVQ